MAETIPVGPYRTLKTPEGEEFPYYIIPFDKDGYCEGPKTQQHLLDHLDGYTDVFLFSHGWNNDWTVATKRYEGFIHGYQKQRVELKLPLPAGYRPLLVGIFWPSQALTWFESETGPDIAAADPAERDAAVETTRETIADIASGLAPSDRARFYELVQAKEVSGEEAQELARMLSGLVAGDDEGVRDDAPSADDLLAAARAIETPKPDLNDVTTTTPGTGGPQAAGIGDVLKALDPRNLVKPFTVWQMKDRSGKVGANGVSRLLQTILGKLGQQPNSARTRVHLLGHSFGCKVVMTALSTLPKGLPKVHSALLLQPAVSQYAFSANVPRRNAPGGFVPALDRVERPIVATFSRHDKPLHDMFHIAVRRHDDLGELQFAGDEQSPSAYAALGGYGPIGADAQLVEIQDAGGAYSFEPGRRIIGIRGHRTIKGHGDISNPSTWWLASTVAAASAPPEN